METTSIIITAVNCNVKKLEIKKKFENLLTKSIFSSIISNVLSDTNNGQVVEWLMAPDCKSGRESVRWFESILAHQNKD